MPLVLVVSKRIGWSLLDHLQTVYLIIATAKEPNTTQDYTWSKSLAWAWIQTQFSRYFESILFVWPWCWNKYTFFFFTALCLLIKDARSWAQLMNDIDNSLKNTNDSILTHILLFGQASLDISANTLILNATRKYIISTKRFQESLSLVFCNFLLHFHLFNFFPSPYYVFFWDYTSIFIWF